MKTLVRKIMNDKLLYVREGDRMTMVRREILRFGVTGVPVLDDAHRPVGFVSLRDLLEKGDEPLDVIGPVVTVRDDDTVLTAARKLGATNFRRAVVVDGAGVAVGIVSAVDFMRELVGEPPRHPRRFDEIPR